LRLGWLAWFFSSLFFPPKTIQFSTNKVQGKHESGMVLDTNSGLFTLVSQVFVHFPYGNFIPNFDLVEYFLRPCGVCDEALLFGFIHFSNVESMVIIYNKMEPYKC
jgi:hypothetical protein